MTGFNWRGGTGGGAPAPPAGCVENGDGDIVAGASVNGGGLLLFLMSYIGLEKSRPSSVPGSKVI